MIQSVQDLGLGVVRPEERLVEVGGPLPAATITGPSAVEAAKSGLEYRPRGDDGTSRGLARKERRLVLEVNPATSGHPILAELVDLLNLQPGLPRYEIVVTPGVVPDPLQAPIPPTGELQASLRSTSQVFFFLANGVEVPCDHLEAGLVKLPAGPDGHPFDGRAVTEGLFSVHASRGHKPPEAAFVAVKYRDYWYYIDDRDQQSKATFALVLSLRITNSTTSRSCERGWQGSAVLRNPGPRNQLSLESRGCGVPQTPATRSPGFRDSGRLLNRRS